jgi:hypothetical protein
MRQQQSYLLRLWKDGKQAGWRVRLENVHTREVKTFASLEQLSDYLQQLTPDDKTKLSQP